MTMNRRRFFKLLPALFGGTVAAAKAGPVVKTFKTNVGVRGLLQLQPYQKAFFFTSTPTGASPFYEYHFREAVRKSQMEWEKSLISMLEEGNDGNAKD